MSSTRLRAFASSGILFFVTLPLTGFLLLFLTVMATDSDESGAIVFSLFSLVVYTLYAYLTSVFISFKQKTTHELFFYPFFHTFYHQHRKAFWVVTILLLIASCGVIFSLGFMIGLPVLFATLLGNWLHPKQEKWKKGTLLFWAISPYVVLALYAVYITLAVLYG